MAADLYLWTESTTYDGNPVTAIKYQTGSHNLAGVCFKVNIVSGNFPAVEDSGNVYQLSDCVDQAKQGTNFPGAHADIYSSGETGNKWELCSGNAAKGIVTLAGTVGLSSSTTNTKVLAYLYGGSYTISEIYSASNSSAQSYTAKDWTYSVGNPNSAPTDITFTPVSELTAGHTGKVGTLSTEDANEGDTHTYTLASTSGGTHASLEIINTNEVHVKTSATIEAKDYTFNITTEDANGGTFSKNFTVTFSAAGNARLRGDLNNDGSVDVADLVFLQKYLNGVTDQVNLAAVDPTFNAAADLNQDESVDVADLVFLQKHLNQVDTFQIPGTSFS